MSSSIVSAKNSRGRPPVDSEAVNVRFARDLLDGIDAFAADADLNPDAPARPETVRRIVRDWLESHHGYLKP